MDKAYYKKTSRAPKGTGRKAVINSIRIPNYIKNSLDEWKNAYEEKLQQKITYEQMFTWWLDNIGYSAEIGRASCRERV